MVGWLMYTYVIGIAGSTREMVKIMQENGEVVVVLGSSANYHNIQTFLTADASLSVEPLYPQVPVPCSPSLFLPSVLDLNYQLRIRILELKIRFGSGSGCNFPGESG